MSGGARAEDCRPPTHVVVAGHSARAAAESAARAGFRVTALDAFADLDQHPSVRVVGVTPAARQRFSAAAAIRAERIRAEAVVYLSGFENHARDVTRLAAGRRLWGNPPEVLHRVRDPFLVAEAFSAGGFRVPSLRGDASDVRAADLAAAWLVKPRASGGGRGVRWWKPRARGTTPRTWRRGCHLQAFVDGIPGSIVFVAANGCAVPLGMTRQLVGETAFGAAGFEYCGSLLVPQTGLDPARDGSGLGARAALLAQEAAAAFALTGVGGVDFVARDGDPVPIEINPRWCASLELVERAFGLSVFGAHARACVDGQLPSFDLASASARRPVVGKAIVFAVADLVAGDTRPWLDDTDLRDVPRPGARIPARRPICTVFAEGADADRCRVALVARAARVYDAVAPWQRRVA